LIPAVHGIYSETDAGRNAKAKQSPDTSSLKASVVQITALVEGCVKSIGKRYSVLVAEGLIPNKGLQFPFEGDDEPYISLEDGLNLGFSEGQTLQHVYVTLLKTVEGTKEYQGPLPESLDATLAL
jgi:hypothetical protein